ncbi:hypothetical protein [Methylobacterium sp. V23]|jgi:hypothetical protein|uniref:hypothetical protein n=1 Tax=Methylobacterium sp. V23 TaxID=2044878 RepID=UPI0011B03998|nr:hypothetical protein [Methylobacterium sp. V23]
MKLIVTGRQNDSDVSFQRSSLDKALQKARDLEAEGFDGVSISDITGRSYGPAEFDDCFVRSPA